MQELWPEPVRLNHGKAEEKVPEESMKKAVLVIFAVIMAAAFVCAQVEASAGIYAQGISYKNNHKITHHKAHVSVHKKQKKRQKSVIKVIQLFLSGENRSNDTAGPGARAGKASYGSIIGSSFNPDKTESIFKQVSGLSILKARK
jgi:hypothetical protein